MQFHSVSIQTDMQFDHILCDPQSRFIFLFQHKFILVEHGVYVHMHAYIVCICVQYSSNVALFSFIYVIIFNVNILCWNSHVEKFAYMYGMYVCM